MFRGYFLSEMVYTRSQSIPENISNFSSACVGAIANFRNLRKKINSDDYKTKCLAVCSVVRCLAKTQPWRIILFYFLFQFYCIKSFLT